MGPVADSHNLACNGPIALVCEHASNHVPPEFDGLGLPENLLASHIAWDPGAFPVAWRMSDRLSAPLVYGCVSRLLYDCNRPPEAVDAVPQRSEIHDIPGNCGLSPQARQRRVDEIYRPFERFLEETFDANRELNCIVTIHSFTPVYRGNSREVEIGVLHGNDPRLALSMMACASSFTDRIVRLNEPYGPEDGVDHTLNRHGCSKGRLNVMIELRNDLIATVGDQLKFADMLCDWIAAALAPLPVAVHA